MTATKTLFKRLERVNTALNLIEDGWPLRPPSHMRRKLEFSSDPKCLSIRAIRSIKEHAQRLADGLPGFQVQVDVYAFTGQQAGCVINVFVNGQAPGRCGCQIYNYDMKNTSKSFTPSLNACVKQWPVEVDRLLKKFDDYPYETFKTKRYNELYRLRQTLNTQWHKVTDPMQTYPYGEHAPEWPVV